MLEADIPEADLIHRFADFLRKLLPQTASTLHRNVTHKPNRPKNEMLDIAERPQRSQIAQRTEPAHVGDANISYVVSKRRPSSGSEDSEKSDPDDDDVRVVYEVSSPNLNTKRFLDEQYGIRRDGKTLMISRSDVIANEKGDITIGV